MGEGRYLEYGCAAPSIECSSHEKRRPNDSGKCSAELWVQPILERPCGGCAGIVRPNAVWIATVSEQVPRLSVGASSPWWHLGSRAGAQGSPGDLVDRQT
jgi:hypothetical protein